MVLAGYATDDDDDDGKNVAYPALVSVSPKTGQHSNIDCMISRNAVTSIFGRRTFPVLRLTCT